MCQTIYMACCDRRTYNYIMKEGEGGNTTI